jgi:hypothetical protein
VGVFITNMNTHFYPISCAGLAPMPLPCSTWIGNNTIDGTYGPTIASSAFFLSSTPAAFTAYLSSSTIRLNVSAFDAYGQLITGAAGSGIVVAAHSPAQLHSQTVLMTNGGVATYSSLALRLEMFIF